MATRNEPPFLLSPLILSCRRTDVAQVLNLKQEPLAGAVECVGSYFTANGSGD